LKSVWILDFIDFRIRILVVELAEKASGKLDVNP
jgi:hypothetical protein